MDHPTNVTESASHERDGFMSKSMRKIGQLHMVLRILGLPTDDMTDAELMQKVNEHVQKHRALLRQHNIQP